MESLDYYVDGFLDYFNIGTRDYVPPFDLDDTPETQPSNISSNSNALFYVLIGAIAVLMIKEIKL